MSDHTIRYWQTLTTDDIASLTERDSVVILPLAATEQHGPHLPLSTDLQIGMGLLAEAFHHLPGNFPAWVLPPQAVGTSLEHMHFPGTLSLDPDVLGESIYQQGAAVAMCGVRRLVLSNSHGGNRQAMDTAGLRLRMEHGLLVVKIHYFDFPPPQDVDLPDTEWRYGLHGGAIETAMMLHLHPELVRTGKVCDGHSLGKDLEHTLRRLRPEGPAAFSWLADDLNHSGIAGDARKADSKMGKRLVAYYGEALADVIQDAKVFPLERLV